MRPVLPLAAWPLIGLLSAGAAPASSFSTSAPLPDFTAPAKRPPAQTAPPGFTTAPTPDQDAAAPRGRASADTSVAPGFFTRSDQYRGEGYSPNSSAQITQDRRAKPGAGISLHMPLQ